MAKKRRTPGRNVQMALLAGYAALVLYLMFFGFGRMRPSSAHQVYHFELIPSGIALWFPRRWNADVLRLWMFSFGNLVVFIPFGIWIPLIFGVRFPKFILLFAASILLLETLQMITFLGRFDINDVIVNSIGAAIGFASHKIGSRAKSAPMKTGGTALWAAALSLAAIGLAEAVNRLF